MGFHCGVRASAGDPRSHAAGALESLAHSADNRIPITKAGGIPPLVELVRDGNDKQKQNAAGALKSLAENAKNREAITKPLVGEALVRDGNVTQKKRAASTTP